MLNDALGRIWLTSDLWTFITIDSYMCITTLFLDKKWVQERILNTYFMPPPHNDMFLSGNIYTLLCEWGNQNKIFALILNNFF